MSNPEPPPPGLSELEDRHRLDEYARRLGCVAVPVAVWKDALIAIGLARALAEEHYRSHPWMAVIRATSDALCITAERIRRERE